MGVLKACAVDLTEYEKVSAIACASISGFTARFISNFRPKCPIIATCTSNDVARSLALNYGVYTKIIPVLNDTNSIIEYATKSTKEFLNLEKEDKIIITGGTPISDEGRITNFIKIEEIN